ncbi:hypothetical protein QAD02_019098 [Eretmocerus hayati]|uniref:Uncharacterized protein n=1 Tax=Eretmocerus hayati TaxID=131215 RepID=A0ACC2PKF7_9HYME|nr:hypothetical protein QAD02_019098 [Eretmocerus hayati]
MELSCFLCSNVIQNGIDELGQHLKNVHAISLTRKLERTGFVCGHGNCREAFDFFYNLRRHIRNQHMAAVPRDQRPSDDTPNLDVGVHLNVDHLDDETQPLMEIDVESCEEQSIGQQTNDENVETEVDLRAEIIKLICKFHGNPSMTGASITNVLESYEKILMMYNTGIRARVTAELRRNTINESVIAKVGSVLEFHSPVTGLKTYDQQIDALVEIGYIPSKEILLGDRIDMVMNRKTNMFEPKIVKETCQFVPTIPVLTMVLSNKAVRDAIENEKPSPPGMIGSFRDGKRFKTNPFFQKYPKAIRLRVYYDEAEIVGPLGSRTGIHKLGGFYYEIANLPPHMNSELTSIHISTLFCSIDVKKYGFEQILGPFMKELEKLESDEGVLLHFGEEEYILRASIENFCGDGLAVHEVFGLLNPSCNLFCRLCLYDREALHEGSLRKFPGRTEAVFREHLQLLEDTNFSKLTQTNTGMREDSVLNRSKYFKTYDCKVFDIMHDYLHGNCPLVIKLVLRQWIIVEERFDVDYLNEAISHFNYGYIENKNKPSANFTRAILNDKKPAINQKACQMWCLIRVLPFLVSGKVPEDDKYLQIVLVLLDIMEIKFAPRIPSDLLSYLDELYKDFFSSFVNLFPEVDPINKLHHGSHGAECIEESGPPSLYNCIRFEAKHGELKLRAQNVHNFKNPPKTLIRVSQAAQYSKWASGDVQINSVEVISGKTSHVCYTKSRQYLLDLNLSDDQEVICAESVLVNGIEYRKKLFIALSESADKYENLMVFGEIREIIVHGEKVFLLTSVCNTMYFDDSVHAYCIELNDLDHSSRFIETSILPFHKPFCYWFKPQSDALHISLRHLIF